MKTLYTIPRHCVDDNIVSNESNIYLNLTTPFLNASKYHTSGFYGSQVSDAFKVEKRKIMFNSSFAETIDDELRNRCHNFSKMFLFGLTSLPTRCGDFRFCNTMECWMFTKLSFAYAKYYKLREEPSDSNLLLAYDCKPSSFRKSRSIVSLIKGFGGTFTRGNVSILNFNL